MSRRKGLNICLNSLSQQAKSAEQNKRKDTGTQKKKESAKDETDTSKRKGKDTLSQNKRKVVGIQEKKESAKSVTETRKKKGEDTAESSIDTLSATPSAKLNKSEIITVDTENEKATYSIEEKNDTVEVVDMPVTTHPPAKMSNFEVNMVDIQNEKATNTNECVEGAGSKSLRKEENSISEPTASALNIESPAGANRKRLCELASKDAILSMIDILARNNGRILESKLKEFYERNPNLDLKDSNEQQKPSPESINAVVDVNTKVNQITPLLQDSTDANKNLDLQVKNKPNFNGMNEFTNQACGFQEIKEIDKSECTSKIRNPGPVLNDSSEQKPFSESTNAVVDVNTEVNQIKPLLQDSINVNQSLDFQHELEKVKSEFNNEMNEFINHTAGDQAIKYIDESELTFEDNVQESREEYTAESLEIDQDGETIKDISGSPSGVKKSGYHSGKNSNASATFISTAINNVNFAFSPPDNNPVFSQSLSFLQPSILMDTDYRNVEIEDILHETLYEQPILEYEPRIQGASLRDSKLQKIDENNRNFYSSPRRPREIDPEEHIEPKTEIYEETVNLNRHQNLSYEFDELGNSKILVDGKVHCCDNKKEKIAFNIDGNALLSFTEKNIAISTSGNWLNCSIQRNRFVFSLMEKDVSSKEANAYNIDESEFKVSEDYVNEPWEEYAEESLKMDPDGETINVISGSTSGVKKSIDIDKSECNSKIRNPYRVLNYSNEDPSSGNIRVVADVSTEVNQMKPWSQESIDVNQSLEFQHEQFIDISESTSGVKKSVKGKVSVTEKDASSKETNASKYNGRNDLSLSKNFDNENAAGTLNTSESTKSKSHAENVLSMKDKPSASSSNHQSLEGTYKDFSEDLKAATDKFAKCFLESLKRHLLKEL